MGNNVQKINNHKNVGIIQVLRYFWKESIQYPWYLLATFIGRSLPLVANIIMPIILKDIVDIMSNTAPEVALPALISKRWFWTVLAILSWLAWRVFDVGTIKLQSHVMKNLYQSAFDYLQRHSYSFFTKTFSGALVRKVGKLSRGYENLIDTLVFDFYPAVSLTIVRITILWILNRKIGLIFAIWIVLHGFTQFLLHKWKFNFDKKANEADSVYTGHLADAISNSSTITAFGSYDFEYKRFVDATKRWMDILLKARWKWPIIGMISGVLVIIAQSLVVRVMIQGWVAGVLSIGEILLIQIYGMATFDILFSIGNTFKRLYQTVADAGEMLEIMQTPHDVKDHTDISIKVNEGRIEFKNVSFAYDNKTNIFNDFSVVIKPGEKVAFVGQSGAGKSSITKLLLRLYDVNNGNILIDNQNISQVSQSSIRQSISFVPQDPILFHRSLKENISYSNPDASNEEIVAASKMARCHEFISKLTNGYDTLVGERGIRLSGGERQRVAIARSILANRRILILDEATSSLDSNSEKLIQEAMDEVMKNKTVIVIAHRLSTIMKMDKIIVMEAGNIIEKGTHKELLLNPDSTYKKLRDIQSGGFTQ